MASKKKPAKKPAGAVAPPRTETKRSAAVRRIRPTVDWVAQVDKAQLPELARTQILSATHFYSGLVRLRADFSKQVLLPPDQHRLPQLLTGTLVLPDGRPARGVAVSMLRFVDGKNASVPPSQATVTDQTGHFIIRGLPSAMLSAKTEVPLLF